MEEKIIAQNSLYVQIPELIQSARKQVAAQVNTALFASNLSDTV